MEDDRHGYGEMRWTDGSGYLGEWDRGIQHGHGKMSYKDGSVKEGYFENNVFKVKLTKELAKEMLKESKMMLE